MRCDGTQREIVGIQSLLKFIRKGPGAHLPARVLPPPLGKRRERGGFRDVPLAAVPDRLALLRVP